MGKGNCKDLSLTLSFSFFENGNGEGATTIYTHIKHQVTRKNSFTKFRNERFLVHHNGRRATMSARSSTHKKTYYIHQRIRRYTWICHCSSRSGRNHTLHIATSESQPRRQRRAIRSEHSVSIEAKTIYMFTSCRRP